MKFKSRKLVLLILGLSLFINTNLYSGIFTSNGTGGGNWSTSASWNKTGIGGSTNYPGEDVAGDTVIISSGDVITLDVNVTAFDVDTINIAGTLSFGSSISNFLSLDVSASVVNAGTINTDDGAFGLHNLNIGKNFDNSSGTFNGDQSGGVNPEFIYVTFTGSGNMVISGAPTFYRLIQTGSGTLSTASSSITITNTFDLQSGDFIVGSGGLVIEAGTVNIKGNSFDALANSSEITFQGSTAPTVDVDGSKIDTLKFYSCIAQGQDLTLKASTSTVDFRFESELALDDQTVLFDADATVESISYGSTAILSYEGSSAQNTGNEWTSSLSPQNVKANNSTGVVVSGAGSAGNRTILGNLTLTQGTLTHNAGTRSLTVGGNITGGSGTYGVSSRDTLILNGTNSTNITIAESFTVSNLVVDKVNASTSVTVVSGGVLKLDKGSGSADSDFNISTGIFIFNDATQLSLQGGSTGDHNMLIGLNGTLETGGINVRNFDSYSVSTGTIVFNGSVQETLPTGITLGTLEVDNSSNAVTSTGILTINDSLVLTMGDITTTSTTILLLDTNATIGGTPGASSMITGPIQKEFNNPDSIIFPLGTGTDYRPLEFGYSSGTFGGIRIIEPEYSRAVFSPKPPPAGIDQIDTQSHYVVNTSGTAPTDFAIFLKGTYEDGNFTPETRNNLLIETAGGYEVGDNQVIDIDNNTVNAEFTNLIPASNNRVVFGRTQLASEITWDGGAGTKDWFNATNWDLNIVPTDTHNVNIIGAVDTVIISTPDDTSAKALTLTLGDGSNEAVLEIVSGDSLQIFSTSSSALTAKINSKIIVGDGDGITFGSSPTYNPDRTNLQNGTTVVYRTGNVPTDTYSNLIIKSGGTAAYGGLTQLTVLNNFEKDSSAAFSSSHDITVSGNYTNTAGNATYGGTNGLTVNGSQLTVTAGTVSGIVDINSTTTTVNGGSFAGYVTLSGTVAQTINGSATAAFDTLEMNNSSGLALGTDVTSDTLVLTNGIVTTSLSNLMSLTTGTTGSANSYVEGPLEIENAIGSLTFPIGGNSYRPVTTDFTASGGSPTIQFEVVDSPPNQEVDALGVDEIVRVSFVRYWMGTINSGGIAAGGTVNLTYGVDDGVDVTGDLRVGYSTDNTSTDPYSSLGGTGSGSPSGNITGTLTGITVLGYFTLGSTTVDNSLPVELSSFTAKAQFKEVILSWKTFSELDNAGFHLYRRQAGIDADWSQLTQSMIQGQGNTARETDYEYIDRSAVSGQKYQYMLESISYSGVRVQEKVIDVDMPVPTEFALLGNYPNPFNPTTNIRFLLPEKSEITLKIYDMRGNLVDTPALKTSFDAGEHDLTWTAQDVSGKKVASGMYIYLFQASNFQKTGKMVLLK